ncbi:MAG TPA: branched-chain amino acid ABC transporter permease [Gaiella sp.]|nr:branched-chain amino acid ABC transporter permease [Gaiella sp.]
MGTRATLAGLIAVAVALYFLPNLQDATGFPTYYLVFAYFLFFWIAQATSWNILSGYTGYFSFGQAAFYGVGVYTVGDLMSRENMSYFVTVPIAGAAAAVLAAGVGALAFRLGSLRGEIFALLTLAVTFTLYSVARISTWVDGGQGIALPVPDYPSFLGDFQDMIYRLSLAVAALAVIVAFVIQRSRFGWGLFSIRDEENVAEELGVPTFRYKMLAITISGFLGGLSGAVAALQIGYLTPEGVFTLNVSVFVIVMSTLGGRGHWLGPVIGALLVYSLQEQLASSGHDRWAQVVLGGILVVVVLFAPQGLYPRLRARPRQALAAGVALVATMLVCGLAGWGDFTDWLGTGLAVATAVVLLGRPKRRRGREGTPAEVPPKPMQDAAAR